MLLQEIREENGRLEEALARANDAVHSLQHQLTSREAAHSSVLAQTDVLHDVTDPTARIQVLESLLASSKVSSLLFCPIDVRVSVAFCSMHC